MKKVVVSGLLLLVIGLVIASILWLFLPSKLPEKVTVTDINQKYAINFAVSSIDTMYHKPESILEDAALFWATDCAYQLVSLAPHYRDTEIPPQEWISNIEKLSSMSIEEREKENGF
jgi:hypothetical protein